MRQVEVEFQIQLQKYAAELENVNLNGILEINKQVIALSNSASNIKTNGANFTSDSALNEILIICIFVVSLPRIDKILIEI